MPASLLLVLTLFSQAVAPAPADPGGWAGAKWGMTTEEVLSAVKGAKKGRSKVFSMNGGPDYLVQWGTTAYGAKVIVNFGFDRAGKLSAVLLQADKANDATFQALKTGLTRDLGEPVMGPTAGARIEGRWTLPATKVLLLFDDPMRDPQVRALRENRSIARTLPPPVPPTIMVMIDRREGG